MRLKRLLDTMEIEVVAVIERQLQKQTVEPGAPRVEEAVRVGPVPLRRNVTVFPPMAKPFDVDAFLRDTLDSLDSAEALCELSMTRSGSGKYKRSTMSTPSEPPPTPAAATLTEATARASEGEEEGGEETDDEDDDDDDDDDDEEEMDDDSGDQELGDVPL